MADPHEHERDHSRTPEPQRAEFKSSADNDPSGVDVAVGEHELPSPAGHDIQREVERAFERLFKSSWLRAFHWDFPSLRESFEARTPRINLIEQPERLVLEAELPGVKKVELRVLVTADRVSIRVERADVGTATADEATDMSAGDYLRREISSCYSARTIALPTPVAADAATALFADGVLTVFLPKTGATEGRLVAIE